MRMRMSIGYSEPPVYMKDMNHLIVSNEKMEET